ncbi:MAG: DUF4166 domain-containing protein [Pseudomonadota bacterium]
MTDIQALPRILIDARASAGTRHGLRDVLGSEAWSRLPEAVRERFAATAGDVTYAGAFEVVRASLLGRAFAWLGTLFGTPVAPRSGENVPARVFVRPHAGGVDWNREYLWADGRSHLVRSTKVITDGGDLIEKLPARLCMPLAVHEAAGVLHFVSRAYYFDLGFGLRLPLPLFFSPGVTHVDHIDLGHGWFRFTLAVTHPLFGEMFFQTGRFCAMEES